MHISAAFDSGNIEVVELSPPKARLRIRKDRNSDFFQWFHFRLSGCRGQAVELRIVNAGQSSYPPGWQDYRAVASDDRQDWRRVPTTYDDGELVIRFTPDADAVWLAYFAPYSLERHADLLAWAQGGGAQLRRLGATLDGRDLDMLTIPGGPKQIWVIARQHPGETMAQWWVEGFLEALLDPADGLARHVRGLATVHVVPNMNPDGSFRGHLRTNAAGVNLNRVWHDPKPSSEPEVALVRDAMDELGLDLALDVHGDENLPHNFIAGPWGIPSFDDRIRELLETFQASYARANPDFQTAVGYPKARPGQANLSMAGKQLAERFSTLAMTLEMPFKDAAEQPDPETGWSPERSKALGASALHPLAAVLPKL